MDLEIPTQNQGPDLAMLFLAMKLCISDLNGTQKFSLYTICKDFLSTLERGGLMTLLGLQASILVALFEHIHVTYPAAWMSIGTCARYAMLLGVTSSTEAYSVLRKVTSWTEIEERRRTGWVLFALDRLSGTGNERSYALPPLTREARLLGDDDS
uniref:Transcription factor domain-containing protein n=2 Tax=Bionectria ochroleuca TaxID=29856 RepID=A0A0B7KIR7_BIOOC